MQEVSQPAAPCHSGDPLPRVRQLIARLFYAPRTLRDDDSLLDTGILDSTAVLEVIAAIETEFRIIVAEDEVVPHNFESIAAISALVERKRG